MTDYETLLENIHGLKAGKPVQVPIYDFKSSSRVGYRSVLILLIFISVVSLFTFPENTLPFCSMVLRIVSSFFFHVPWSLQKKKYLLCKGVG